VAVFGTGARGKERSSPSDGEHEQESPRDVMKGNG
jgi:hypothetical protein